MGLVPGFYSGELDGELVREHIDILCDYVQRILGTHETRFMYPWTAKLRTQVGL